MTAPATAPLSNPTLFLTDQDVRAVFDWSQAIEVLRAAYAGKISPAMIPPRTMARGDRVWLRSLSALSPAGDVMGNKLIAASIKSRRASYLISVFNQNNAELEALVDGATVTGVRTAATSALAVKLIAPDRALRVGVLGTGFEAKSHILAMAQVRTFASLRVYSPRAESRARLVEELKSEFDLTATGADSAQEAVKSAELLICAARSRDETPILDGRWLEPGTTVISIGSTLPEQREVDTETLRRATVIVADMPEEVAHDTGDFLAAKRDGADISGKVISLADVVSGRLRARNSDQDIVLYKSVGSALQDVIIAQMCVDLARKAGRGFAMPVGIAVVSK